MTTGRFHGAFTALVTPFKNGKIDEEAYREFIEWQIEQGIDGLVPCGTTGESATMTHDEHEAAIRICVEQVNKRVPVIAGAGSNNTREAIPLTQFAKNVGADAALHITPYYNKPTQEGLYQHFKTICSEVSMPVILYNVPGRTGCNMLPPTVARIARDVPDVVGIKEASGSLEQVDEIIKNKPEGFEVISGDDALTFPMIASGAVGVISVIGNALPRQFSRMIRLEFEGNYGEARKIHHQFTELYKLLFVDGNPAGVKALLNDMGMIENVLRLPLVPTEVTTKQKMADILKALHVE
ncbi:MAG: 4-hydroxy-tetrahydrodipicolinate synthase [Prevotella sp.]|nr:4-hydroxy-tetrahydrodipicolinate synthase [Prevotella sp.]